MNNRFIAALLCFFLCFVSLRVNANPVGPSIEEIENFDSFYFGSIRDGKYYDGVLISIPEYERYIRVEKELVNTEKMLSIAVEKNEGYNLLLSKWDLLSQDIKTDINDIKVEMRPSFWDEWKAEIGFASGVVLTILVVITVQQ